jgi:hypothetical protein
MMTGSWEIKQVVLRPYENLRARDLQTFLATAIPQTIILCSEKNVCPNSLLNFCGSHWLNLQVRIFIVKTH